MIVVDSSVFIEFYRPKGRKDVKDAVSEVISTDQTAVNGIIQTEVVGFAKGRDAYRTLMDDFSVFHWFDLTKDTFDKASEMGHVLRAEGITVPSTDLIIAASTILGDAILYHMDRHFVLIGEHFEIKQRSFL